MLDAKLQLKPGQTIAVLGATTRLNLAAAPADPDHADAILVFVANMAQLDESTGQLHTAAAANKLTWVAYPKAGQLGTDLNRDRIRDWANAHGLDPVRQIAVDDTWSALRLKQFAGNTG